MRAFKALDWPKLWLKIQRLDNNSNPTKGNLGHFDRLESCMGQVHLCRLQVPEFAGRAQEPALLCMKVRIEPAVGWGRSMLYFLQVRSRMRNSLCR